jgi:glycosyltransferase involved in cell wall biosynthesis
MDGVHIVRAGRQWTVHWSAFRRYRRKLSLHFDLVIDEVNTIPFFTPLWSDIPVVMFIHQLAREVWLYESPFPLSVLGFATESLYLRTYRNAPVITVSDSTRSDLLGLGFQGMISVVPQGLLPMASSEPTEKAEVPTLIYVGRLSPSKRIEHMIRALALYRHATGQGTLWLVGGGSAAYRDSIERLAKKLNVSDRVVFWGRVTEPVKLQLMARAHLLLMTSVREGWGLVVSEANACGTPAVVYDVPGLRDSVRSGVTGYVVDQRPETLAACIERVLGDRRAYNATARRARSTAETMSFDKTADAVEALLATVIEGDLPSHSGPSRERSD